MNKLFFILLFLTLTGCHNGQRPVKKIVVVKKTAVPDTSDNDDNNKIKYTDAQLEAFLDSVRHLPTQPLADKAAFGADSVFKSPKQMDTVISPNDLKTLKHAIRKGYISVKIARRIFRNKEIDSTCTWKNVYVNYKQGLTPVVFYSFDKNKNDLNEYAICIGDPGNCPNACLYFFKGNRIIAKHNGYDRFGNDLEHYKDADGKTIVYNTVSFDEGSGIWWNNFFFYKYDGDKLIPVLNEVQNANMQSVWGLRILWLESTILKTNPLTIKMVYYGQFYSGPSDTGFVESPRIIDDSTTVRYVWDEHSKTLQGQYAQSKISKAQILSYYLVDNDLLFVNAYYKTLKASLLDKTKRRWTLDYLNKVKNYYGGKKGN